MKGTYVTVTTAFMLAASSALAAPGTPYSDEWVEGRVRGVLDFNSYFDSTDIEVRVKNGEATLMGQVPSEIEKRYASSLTTALDGVKSVVNKLEINPALAPRSRSAMAQAYYDSTTTAMVEARLSSSRVISGAPITVSTRNGVVQLNGKVASSDARTYAGRIARSTTNVISVDNNLKIENPKTIGDKVENALVSTSNAVSDVWIAAKVRTLLAFGTEFSGSDVSPSVKEGRVTLKGSVKSPEQSAEIAKETAEVVGVREVDNQLTLREVADS